MNAGELSEAERSQWEQASAYIDDGSYAATEAILDQLLTEQRFEARLYAHRGYVRYKLEDYQQAIDDFSVALDLQPQAPNTLFLRGRCLEEIGRFDEAVSDYDKVIAIIPETADAYAQKGFCLEQLNRTGEARSAYQRALQIDPQESLALAGLKQL